MSGADKYDYMLDDLAEDVASIRANQREIFQRLNHLERQMAQGVMLGIVFSIIAPVIVAGVITAALQ